MTEQELIQKATKLIRRYDNMRILGARGEWSGSARQGFMFNPQRGGGGAGGGGGGGPATGACCFDEEVCLITTPVDCTIQGGTYQGDNTTCDPNPCIAGTTGACCFEDFTCQENLTESDCESFGGSYQGDGTLCEPSPCCQSICSTFRSFVDPDDPRRWGTRTLVTTISTSVTGPEGYFCNLSWNTTTVRSIDPETCEESLSCAGNIEWNGSDPPNSISETWQHGTDTCFSSECCHRIPLDSIPACAGDVGVCSITYNELPPFPDHVGWTSVTETVAVLTASSHGSADGYTWDCTAMATDTLTGLMFSPCE